MSLEEKIEQVRTLLAEIERDYSPAAFANSFGAEDMVLTDLVAGHCPGIEIFTLDTGRLPEETHNLMREVVDRYRVRLRIYYPDTRSVERYVSEHGPNSFYQSVELRKACCEVRKVEPLRRALAGKKAWVTGLRREQAVTRKELSVSGFDHDNELHKFNPLADWTGPDVWAYIRSHAVPFNALHEKGYPSIGCAPCTRAVKPGEDIRAGRWWWEHPDTKECGLHIGSEAAVGNHISAESVRRRNREWRQ
ncbi:MAG: phosphoadenosine phosphosulfate reductase [Deltaproteobacteria bacterium RBG_16_55_12]|nr:MAG: phosphoadenosine phosphosulfate reductase [Deltaproteobacteria bacterium RBG_16_55_12]